MEGTAKLVKYPACCICQKILKTNVKLRCTCCKKYYDIDCAGVTITRFGMMEKCKKEGWKCRSCYDKNSVPVSSCYANTPSSSNVTHRKPVPKAILLTPLHKSEEEESTSTDDDLHSMPDISTSTFKNEKEIELMNAITQLKLELQIAHTEIENLMMENSEIKKQIQEKDSLAVKWKKSFTEAISTPKKRNSIAKTDKSTKKSAKKKKTSRAIDLNESSSSSTSEVRSTKEISPSTNKHRKNENNEMLDNRKKLTKNKRVIKIKENLKNNNNVIIFSDGIGQGIAIKITEKTDSQAYNICKPDAGFQPILENFKNETNCLEKCDTAAILITKYDNSIYYHKRKYIRLLNSIINDAERKYNVLITGLRYNGMHNEDIYNINMQIANMARVNENVKYIDPNTRFENTKNYLALKKFVTEHVISCLKNTFIGNSSLRFINREEPHSTTTTRTNFPIMQRISQKP